MTAALEMHARPAVVLHYRLPEHPPRAWATVISRAGQTRDELLRELHERWPLAEPHNYPRTAP